MKNNTKIMILVLVLMLTVGFAAVTTSLLINGNTSIGTNTNDFNVYFSNATTDASGSAIISTDKKTITFNSKSLDTVGDEAFLEYVVKNDSSQYDANVTVTFVANNMVNNEDMSSYYSITRTGFEEGSSTVVEGKSKKTGRIVIKLLKAPTTSFQITFTVTLDVDADERTVEATNNVKSEYTLVSGDLDTIGSVVKIADEEFYVIGKEGDNIKLLSKWNLNWDEDYYDMNQITNVRQDETLIDVDWGKKGTRVFSSYGYWDKGLCYENNETYKCRFNVEDGYFDIEDKQFYYYDRPNERGLLNEYSGSYSGNPYPYVYNENSDLYSIVEEYVKSLTSQDMIVRGRLISAEELIQLGCDDTTRLCDSAPSWVYQTRYWTGSADSEDTIKTIYHNDYYGYDFFRTGAFGNYSISNFGVRPVIIIEP